MIAKNDTSPNPRPTSLFSPDDPHPASNHPLPLPQARDSGRSGEDELKQTLREMVAETQELKAAAGGSVTDAVADWLAPQYLLAARAKLTASAEAGRFEVLRTFLHDWVLLRRGDHSAARLQLDREDLDWQRANSQSQKEQDFREWVQRPEVHREFLPETTRGIRPETIKKIERELRLL